MTEKRKDLSAYNSGSVPDGKYLKIGVVVSEWNPNITSALLSGCLTTLGNHGLPEAQVKIIHVPGTFELPTGAQWLFNHGNPDAVICLGCIIKGETRHDEYISQAVANGLTNLALKMNKPVIFGVLTTENMYQAVDRAGGKHGNKGIEAAVTALKMIGLHNELNKGDRKIGY